MLCNYCIYNQCARFRGCFQSILTQKSSKKSHDRCFKSQRLRTFNRCYRRDHTARRHKEIPVHGIIPWFLQIHWNESVIASVTRLYWKDVVKFLVKIGFGHLYQSKNIQNLKIERNWQ